MTEFKQGDRVRRKKEQEYTCNKGTVISINDYGKVIVKWDEKASNGQQQSTLDKKVLIHLTN